MPYSVYIFWYLGVFGDYFVCKNTIYVDTSIRNNNNLMNTDMFNISCSCHVLLTQAIWIGDSFLESLGCFWGGSWTSSRWACFAKGKPGGKLIFEPLVDTWLKDFLLWSSKSVRQCIIVTSRFLDGWPLSLQAPQGEEGDWDSRVVGTPYLVPPQGHVRALSRYSNEALPEGVWDSPLCHSATGPMAPVLCWWGGPL